MTNPHSSPEHQQVARHHEILRCLVGSTTYGTALDGQGDRDEMGICVEPPACVTGLREFEQYIHRTRLEGERSGPGDLDLTVYGLRKWTRLAVQGNPTVLLLLFTQDEHVLIRTELGDELRALAPAVASRQAGHRFLGYLRAQRDQLTGVRGGRHTNRPELVARHGFDTKFAMHMIRLGVQGVALLETGRVTLPMPEPWGSWCRALRRGEHTLGEALTAAADLEQQLTGLLATSPLPERPDLDTVNDWLASAYRRAWRWGERAAPDRETRATDSNWRPDVAR